MLDRPGFPGQPRRRDDVDARHAEQQNIGRFDEKTGHFPLRRRNLFVQQLAHLVQLLPLPRVHPREFRGLGREAPAQATMRSIVRV